MWGERTKALNRGGRDEKKFHFVVDQSGVDQSEFSSSVLFGLRQAILLLWAVFLLIELGIHPKAFL